MGGYGIVGTNPAENQKIYAEQIANIATYNSKQTNADISKVLRGISARKFQPINPTNLFKSMAYGMGLKPKEVKKYLIDNPITGGFAKNEAAMTTLDQIMKYVLIVGGIAVAATVLSGCVAHAPDTTYSEQAIQKLLDDDTPINNINDMIKPVAEQNNYDVDVVKSDSTGEIVSIGVDDGKGNHVRFINDDANPDVDRATLNGKQIYPTTGEATSTQTQLGGAPTATSGDFAGMSPEQVYRAAVDNPDSLIGQPISLLVIDDPLIEETGTNRYNLQNKEISDSFSKKHDGITSYRINTNGVSPTNILIRTNDGLGITVKDNNNDGIIDETFEM